MLDSDLAFSNTTKKPTILTWRPDMIGKSVRVGREDFFIFAESLEELAAAERVFYAMARRVTDDAYLRVRTNENGSFMEFVSPRLGYATRSVSINREDNARVKAYPYYIGLLTPWVRWDKDNERNIVMFDQEAFEHAGDTLKSLGFERPEVWYPAERVKDKKLKKWVWRKV